MRSSYHFRKRLLANYVVFQQLCEFAEQAWPREIDIETPVLTGVEYIPNR